MHMRRRQTRTSRGRAGSPEPRSRRKLSLTAWLSSENGRLPEKDEGFAARGAMRARAGRELGRCTRLDELSGSCNARIEGWVG